MNIWLMIVLAGLLIGSLFWRLNDGDTFIEWLVVVAIYIAIFAAITFGVPALVFALT